MKSKFSKILSVGLVLAVLASLLVISTPASAGYMSWSKFSAPTTVSDVDLLDIAVASNGTTAYGVANAGKLYKTTNGGSTWTALGWANGQATGVAVAPDSTDGSFIAVTTATKIYLSDNGGTNYYDYTPIGATAVNDVAISATLAGGRVVAVAGSDGNAALYYRTIGSGGLGSSDWVDAFTMDSGNVTAANTALAVAISPNYASDATLVVVTSNGTTAIANLFNTITKKWNSGLVNTYGTAWGTGKALSANATKAEIALPGTYSGFGATTRVAYIGMDVGGLIRLNDTAIASLITSGIYSVSLNSAGDKLIAGATAANTVYSIASPATATSLSVGMALKAPSYSTASMVTARFFGANIGAATVGGAPGDESAFSLSTDGGVSFNDVALVDSVLGAVDYAVNADGSKAYLVSENAGITSVWRLTTAWERVMTISGTAYIVRPAMDNFDVVYLADTGSFNIYYSNDAGQTSWQPRSCWVAITDLAAETASTVYVLSGTGVIKSTSGANGWTTAAATATGAGTGNSMKLVSAGNLLVAGTTGIAYTADGGTTWNSTGLTLANAAAATAGSLASGGVITAVSPAGISQFTIGTSTAFGAAITVAGTANSVVINGAVTYALTSSNMYRSPITATTWEDIAVTGLTKITAASGGVLYALNTTANEIDVFTEIFAAAGPTLTGPADKFIDPINMETGYANNLVFQWTGIPNATGATYELVIALDNAFVQKVKTFSALSGGIAIIGYTADLEFAWQADTTYYWRMRADSPFDSPWSATRSFKIDTLAPVKLVSPTNGAMDVSVTPTFAWSPAAGATGYELVVSDDPTFAIITFSRTSTQAVFASDEQLAYSTVYYWRVRPTGPAYPSTGTPYVTGIFTTEERAPEPTTPPPTTTTTTTITISVPPATEAIPAYLLWIIIGIGAILVIALIVLIVRTRRVS